jgi:hypothetical protein
MYRLIRVVSLKEGGLVEELEQLVVDRVEPMADVLDLDGAQHGPLAAPVLVELVRPCGRVERATRHWCAQETGSLTAAWEDGAHAAQRGCLEGRSHHSLARLSNESGRIPGGRPCPFVHATVQASLALRRLADHPFLAAFIGGMHESRRACVDGRRKLEPPALEELLASSRQVVRIYGRGDGLPALLRNLGLGLAEKDGTLASNKLHQRLLGEADILWS